MNAFGNDRKWIVGIQSYYGPLATQLVSCIAKLYWLPYGMGKYEIIDLSCRKVFMVVFNFGFQILHDRVVSRFYSAFFNFYLQFSKFETLVDCQFSIFNLWFPVLSVFQFYMLDERQDCE